MDTRRVSKSILDGVPVVDNAFKHLSSVKPVLEIVSDCPKCGAPIYGQKMVRVGETPQVQYSCACNSSVHNLKAQTKEQSMDVKTK